MAGGAQSESAAALVAALRGSLRAQGERERATLMEEAGVLSAQRARFQGEHGPERLSALDDAGLLQRLPLRGEGSGATDSLDGWLVRRTRADFDTRRFGALTEAPGPVQDTHGSWRGAQEDPEISEAAALALLRERRQELLAAVAVLATFEVQVLEEVDAEALQAAMARAAPRHHHSAWLHKYLHLIRPRLVTHLPSLSEAQTLLARLGLPAPAGRYACDVLLLRFFSGLEELRGMPSQLRYRVGLRTLRTLCGEEPGGARRVTSGKAAGTRDLSAAALRAQAQERLQRSLAGFFAAEGGTQGVGEAPGEEGWGATLGLEVEGLVLWIEPLRGLPSFVKQLCLAMDGRVQTLLAANLRGQRFRVAVPPSRAPYVLTAPGFEEEVGAALSALTQPGLGATTAFVARAGGWARVKEAALRAGGRYRLVLAEGEAIGEPLGEGFRVVDVTLPLQVPPETRDWLGRLGFQVSGAALRADFCGWPPLRYETGRGGERYPVFAAGEVPELHMEHGGEVLLLCQQEDGTRGELLLKGDSRARLAGLSAGRYALALLPQAMEVAPERLYFAVSSEAARPVPAQAEIQVGAARLVLAGADARWQGDLSDLGDAGALLALQMRAPPRWPVRVTWEGAQAPRWLQVHADAAGVVPVTEVLTATAAARRGTRLGVLRLDFAELGVAELRHQREVTIEEAGARLRALWQERGALAAAAAGNYALLRGAFLEPLCAVLGYTLHGLPPAVLPEPPSGVAAALLDAALVSEDDRVLSRPAAVLLVCGADADLRSSAGAVRGYAERLSRALGVKRALVTDGPRWAVLTKGRRFVTVHRLPAALEEESLLENFLAAFLAEEQSWS